MKYFFLTLKPMDIVYKVEYANVIEDKREFSKASTRVNSLKWVVVDSWYNMYYYKCKGKLIWREIY